MQQVVLEVSHEVGLHARPASLFVKTASSFEADIQVRNQSKDSPWVDCKSILSVLTLEVEQNHLIELKAEGQDAAQAIARLKALVESNFQMEEPPD